MIGEVEAEQQIAPSKREARFEDAVDIWFEHLEFEKRAKPSTLSGYRSLLAKPKQRHSKLNGARIMREFGGRKLATITTKDVHRFLGKIDREGISARTVNVHRQILHSIFEHARRAETSKRPEEGPRPVETFEPEEITAIAGAARAGLHRGQGGYEHSEYSAETQREWVRVQRAGRGALPNRRLHRPEARRAARPALVRRRPRGPHPDGLQVDVRWRGVEHQVTPLSLGASRRPGRLGAEGTSEASLL